MPQRSIPVALPTCTAPTSAVREGIPPWAVDVDTSDGAAKRGSGWTGVPQPGDAVALAQAPGAAARTEQGARLACLIELEPTDRTVEIEIRTSLGGEVHGWKTATPRAYTIPGIDVAPGMTLTASATRDDAKCTEGVSVVMLLMTGLPLPACPEKFTKLWDVTVPWNGGAVDLSGHGRCVVQSRADVDAAVDALQGEFDRLTSEVCGMPLLPDAEPPSFDQPWRGIQAELVRAAAIGGWDHPVVEGRVATYEALRADWEAALAAQVAIDAAALTSGPIAVSGGELTAEMGGIAPCRDTCSYTVTYAATGSVAYELSATGSVEDPTTAWGTVVADVGVVYPDGSEVPATFAGPWGPLPLAPSVVVTYEVAAGARPAFFVLRGPDGTARARLAVP